MGGLDPACSGSYSLCAHSAAEAALPPKLGGLRPFMSPLIPLSSHALVLSSHAIPLSSCQGTDPLSFESNEVPPLGPSNLASPPLLSSALCSSILFLASPVLCSCCAARFCVPPLFFSPLLSHPPYTLPPTQRGRAQGLSVSWRNGEPGHGGRAEAVNASAFALVYVW